MPTILGAEILKRAPNFFNGIRIKQLIHCLDRLEYVFPEVDWKDVSVDELREAVGQALVSEAAQAVAEETLTDALLDAYERAEEVDAALQEFWPALETTLHNDILERLAEAIAKTQTIQRIVTDALGGYDKLNRLRRERGTDDPLDERG